MNKSYHWNKLHLRARIPRDARVVFRIGGNNYRLVLRSNFPHRMDNEIEKLMSAEAGTTEGERLDVLATLVEAYERKLHRGLGIPAESLIKQADRRKAP